MQFKKDVITSALQEAQGNYDQAARLLGLGVKTLRKYHQLVS